MPVILIVEVQRAEQTPLCARLREEGYHTLSVGDLASALDTLNCIRADLLLVDVARVDGNTSARLTKLRDRELYKEMPVVFVLPGTDNGDALRSSVGTDAVVVRRQPLDDLVEQVRGYVEPLSVPYN